MQHDFQAAQQTAAFPLYIPDLPSGYIYNAGSLHGASSVIVYTLTTNGGQLAVTEQSKPADFDFSQLSGTQEFTTSVGKAYIEDFQTRTTGSLIGDKTWVIINAPNPIGAGQMDLLLRSFQPLK